MHESDGKRQYVIDSTLVLQKTYRLLCTFFANKEIMRRSHPRDKDAPLSSLENMFFVREASQLLIEIAGSIRVLDDQMRNLSEDDTRRQTYYERRYLVDKYQYGLFDDLNLDLRETCNKIIHSDVMEPHTSTGYEAHADDLEHLHGDADRTIDWKHFNGYVRLCGKHRGKEWYVLLDIEVFVSAIVRLLKPLE